MDRIELLAPAKDLECGVAAIDCGADAVYIGAPRFGAREAAGNALSDISDLVAYAHKYWARIYVTINTLLRDDEIQDAVDMIHQLHRVGVDGIIVQDMGLLECDLPPVPLIASTQMHSNTPEKVAFLEQVGIKRAILARELDIDQVREICQHTNIELEYFIHGALCVCYSGQCYLSYALGGRSGNRGQCAQPCRLPYTLLDGRGRVLAKNKHLLSIQDLNLSDHLRELLAAGICSFKIEGRLKDRAYVSNVVSYYRSRLDEALAEMGMRKSSSGTSTVSFEPDVNKTFNRGYCTYFLHGRKRRIGSIDTPKMVGEPVGKVQSVRGNRVTLDTRIDLHPGDGICFFDSKGELRGTLINGVRGQVILPDKMEAIRPGVMIYRNSDSEFLRGQEKAHVQRRVEIVIRLEETSEGFALTAEDEDGNTAHYEMDHPKTPADKPEQALDNIRSQLAKCGGTMFACSRVEIDLSRPWFMPISALNSMRRGVLEELQAARLRNRPVDKVKREVNNAPYPQRELTFEGNVLNSKARAFYRRHGVDKIEPAAESGLDLRGRKVMTTRYCLRHQLGKCEKRNEAGRSPEPWYLVDSEGHRLELRFDCTRCGMDIYLCR